MSLGGERIFYDLVVMGKDGLVRFRDNGPDCGNTHRTNEATSRAHQIGLFKPTRNSINVCTMLEGT